MDHISVELSTIEQDTLAEIGNISMGSAATALSTLVNRKVRITVPDVYISDLSAISESYPVPCVLVNVQYLKGLQGENILVINEKDATIIGDLMMGGDGSKLPEELDEMYLSAVTEAMNMMMGSAATAMSDLFDDTIDISPPTTELRDLSQESLVQTLPAQGSVVAIAFRIEIDNLVDSTMLQVIDLKFAKRMVDMLLPPEDITPVESVPAKVSSWDDLKPQDSRGETQPHTHESQHHEPQHQEALDSNGLGNLKVNLIRDIPVQVRAILGRTTMTIDQILRLGPAHIMELDSFQGEPIEVYANDTLIAKGEVVVVGEQFGIRVTEISAPKDRVSSVR